MLSLIAKLIFKEHKFAYLLIWEDLDLIKLDPVLTKETKLTQSKDLKSESYMCIYNKILI